MNINNLKFIGIGVIGCTLGAIYQELYNRKYIGKLKNVISLEEEIITWVPKAILSGINYEDFARQFDEKNAFLVIALTQIAESDKKLTIKDVDTGETWG